MVQSAIISRLPLLQGTANLVQLVLIAWGLQERVNNSWVWVILGGFLVSYVSALPFFTPLIVFLVVNALTRLFQSRIWQTPILAMLMLSVLATFIEHFVSIFALRLVGTVIPLGITLKQITLPSTLLNLLFALPVYAVMHDLANSLYPLEVEV